MENTSKQPPIKLNGRWQYRLQSILVLYWSMIYVTVRRLFRGPHFPNWGWTLEMSTHFMKTQGNISFDMPDIKDGREYEDSLLFGSPAVASVSIEAVNGPIKGHWYQPTSAVRDVTVLYLHGGGYVYYSKVHENLIALTTLAAESRTFALDYRLCPEHAFPAQREDALAAYRWLLEGGVNPERLVVMGDSAGGNLTLTLLLALREARLPFPALAVCIAPWTDLSNSGESMITNTDHDWLGAHMARKWSHWFCKDADVNNPLVSPVHADLRGLPPIYIQVGSAEILLDMIRNLADRGREQGANIKLEVWPNMTHDFQAFGDIVPESREALDRIGEVVRKYVG